VKLVPIYTKNKRDKWITSKHRNI